MLIFVFAIILFLLGIWLSNRFSFPFLCDFFIWLLTCSILLVGSFISRSPYFYDLDKSTDTIITFADNLYYQNDEEEKILSFSLKDNDNVSHIETIHYESLNIEYSKNISTAESTIETYSRKAKYKWLIYDVMSGKIANVNLRLPESYKESGSFTS